ncbi:EF-hand [Gloeophyllum trabeum ATCC 11539]|uniref:EF-hand n=1 Tax=Gloeophyllum trabeum (strain ATCC 11539 / FP-39264 / Madison 617) TaxID=670483 RepID=S7RYB3_GLOTA|nr:EF-hand [Gloeophyllum trabeum ATCC 11539]EPQ58394.1 EF-hand [Gloeophyllum trabeum ATCC 11539]
MYSHPSQRSHHGPLHHSHSQSRQSYQNYGTAPPSYGGYGPPPNADPQLWRWFSTVDTDRSGQISLNELQAALVNGNWTKFDLDTVKMLMNMFDSDRSGTIGFNEFAGLWKYIADWQNVFRHFDRDGSGTIEGHELSEALRSFGYNLSPRLLQLVETKYAAGPTSGYAPPPGISFDRFVRACVVVKSLTEAFQQLDTDRDGWVQVSYQQFMEMFLRAP